VTANWMGTPLMIRNPSAGHVHAKKGRIQTAEGPFLNTRGWLR